ncbi:homoserine dehydrogenase [Faecalibaculum rodentium]|uniref:homoserine dehydrogenase n=1 Tax=Faecalibaculum rodentium TaxID=1702221 RepID=UPI00248B87BD|nr:homoserine dehydrogenase [Faecalibaculum rodentium]
MQAVLLGYGTVGKGVEKLVNTVDGLDMKAVFVLPEFEDLPYFSNDGEGLVTDPDVDVVFECLSGTEPSNTLIRKALQAGKHVITSNKATVAPNLEDYVKLAEENGGSIQIEASVAGGIPFLDAVLKLQKLEDLNGFEGIFNGTSNYILDQMQKEGQDLSTALRDAQAMGYAEADPTNDVEGMDVWYKTVITNMLAYNTKNDGLRKPLGISKLTPEDIALARGENKVIRHISRSVQKDGRYASVIAPAFLDGDDYLANVPSNYNAQLIYADSFDKIGLFGQGAGQMATAQAMLANALDTMEGTERPIRLDRNLKQDDSLIQETWLVRSEADLSSIPTARVKEGSYWLIGPAGADVIGRIQELDPQAMIALWR